MTLGARLRLPLVIIVALVAQSTVLTALKIHGAHPDLMLLLGISAAMVAGPSKGAVVGFVSGIAADLLLDTPFGLSALTYTVVAYAVGILQTATLRPSRVLVPLTAILASAAGIMGYAVLGSLVGQSEMLHGNLPYVVAVVSVANGILALPVNRMMAWALPGEMLALSEANNLIR